ncbi:MAG: tetratricopeptide repeat protein [Gemmatales bacterium]
MIDHPSTELLSRYLAGRTSANESQLVEQHIAQCEECTSQLDKISSQGDAFEAKLVASAQSSKPDIERSSGVTSGTKVGTYVLRELLGQGGMGQVWQAEQTEPIKRTVAIKLVKSDLAGRQVLARFEAERQALTMMDHPNIARILDAGAMPDGKPYFVMELVRGIPINRYCDEARLNTEERLALFIPVCQAIQHAHQKGIIHRDLKPSNILITQYDGKPVPKVIDFGVAKAVHQPLTDQSMQTELGSLIGTLEYMSPEQADLNNLDIDTRADIYSLGVILYELLAGSPPFSSKQLRAAAFTEMLRLIREIDPPKPSTKLSKSEALPSIAANRKLEPRRLQTLVTGDLDWIVMKALAKERNQRYDSANGFAQDIQRYLVNEPVQAGPPSASYRLRKFVQRNRGSVLAASLLLVTLVAGIIGTSIGYYRAEMARTEEAKQRQLAQKKEKEAQLEKANAVKAAEAEKVARLKETEEKQFAQAISDFVWSDLLALTSVEGQLRFAGEDKLPLDRNMTVKQLLDRAGEKLKKRKDLAPRIEAELNWIIGVNYRGLGDYQRAVPFLERTVELHRKNYGADAPPTLGAEESLAVAYVYNDQAKQAIELLLRVRKEMLARLGPDQLDVIINLHNLAGAYEATSQFDKAIPLFEQVRDAKVKRFGMNHPETLLTLASLGKAYLKVGRNQDALVLLEKVRDGRIATGGAEHPNAVEAMEMLAQAYNVNGRVAQAIELYEEVRKGRIAIVGADHAKTIATTNNLATAYFAARRYTDALKLLEQVNQYYSQKLDSKNSTRLIVMGNLASCYYELGRYVEAVQLQEKVRDSLIAKLGEDHPDTLFTLNNLAKTYSKSKRIPEALLHHEKAASGIERLQFNNQDASRIVLEAISAYDAAKQLDKAASWRRKWLAAMKQRSLTDSTAYSNVMFGLGINLCQQNKWAEADPVLYECLVQSQKKSPNSWETFDTQYWLGHVLLKLKKYQEAETHLLSAYQGLKQNEKLIPAPFKNKISMTLDHLIQVYTETNKPDEVKKWQAEKLKLTPPAAQQK